MAKTNTGKTAFLCGESMMMFQFAGKVQIALLSDDRIDDFAARTCANGCFFYQSVLFADDSESPGTGIFFYSLNNFS